MSVTWPPSPSVEDEASALAHECLLDSAVEKLKSDDQPAGNRGTVNQYPIILDSDQDTVSQKEEAKDHSHPCTSSAGAQSSDESSGPATPPPTNRDQRFVHIPSQQSKRLPTKEEKARSKSDSNLRIKEEDTSRGRPSISRIETDVGSDLPEMVTGKRRAPSPYAYKASQIVAEKIYPVRRFSGEQLLSPQLPNGHKQLGVNRFGPAVSAKPRAKEEFDSSTDSDKVPEGRHHSRRRSSRKSFSHPIRPALDQPSPVVEKITRHQATPFTESNLLSKGPQGSVKPTHPDTLQSQSKG